MANKKDDDFDLPRHVKQLDQRQASSRHAPRRSIILRFAVYVIIVLAVIYGFKHGIGTWSDHSPSLPRSRPPDEAPPPRSHDDRPVVNEASHQDKIPLEPIPKSEPKFESKLETVPEPPKLEPKPDAKEPKDSPNLHQEPPIPVIEPAKTPSRYNGPLRFSQLANSLYSKAASNDRYQPSRNVLFAAASLKSAATLLPMACQMAAEGLNSVHFALMSQDDMPMEELLKINGVDERCETTMLVHDARPDHAMKFTKLRMALATARGFYHINRFISVKAIIVDASKAEEEYFLSGIRDEIRTLEATLIELPPRAGSRFSWLTKLDGAALAAWNQVHIDILIHTSPQGFGNLKRLLSSLARADIDGMAPPHMTIELPSGIDPNLAHFLAEYRWPAPFSHPESFPQMLSLRHRIPREKMNEEEASARFLESFWPSRPSHHHILILSPHTEVSRQFFHYVKYSLLKYRYSTTAIREQWYDKLMGFSFSAPQTYLDDATKFVPPQAPDEWNMEDGGTPFLWQAPSSDAMLILGDKWVELHGYVSQYLQKQQGAAGGKTGRFMGKEISKNHPVWLEYVLQLSRLRGYVTLHPSPETADAILGVHSDLFDAPEEYEGEDGMVKEGESISKQAAETYDSGSRVDMLTTLPNKGELPMLHSLPWLSWNGKQAGQDKIQHESMLYRRAFREQVGQCSKEEAARYATASADAEAKDLFCAAAAAAAKT